MIVATITTFVETLSRQGLLNSGQLSELRSFSTQFGEPQSLAGELVRREWLTSFQADQLLQNSGEFLVLGQYVLLARLGEGGMGEVFKARHAKLGRLVALKVIRKERINNEDAVRRFEREIQAVAQVSHKNIVLAYDSGHAGDRHFFAMEYVEGTDLARLVKQNGPLPFPLAAEYVRQAALGLQHAHEKNLVHRDIKPANLLVTARDHVVKITDLGLARLTRSGDDSVSTVTREGSVLGTLDYVAPEQAADSHRVDIRADIYSLGCTLYFLLCGRAPFAGGEAIEKLYRHRYEQPAALTQFRPDIPPSLLAVIDQMMAKRPEDRYQTPAEVADAVASALIAKSATSAQMSQTAVVRNVEFVHSAGEKGPPASRKRSPLFAIMVGTGAVLLFGFVTLAVFWIAHSTNQPSATEHSPVIVVSRKPNADPPATKKTDNQPTFVKKDTREETILATLQANRLPTLEGFWHIIGPFDNSGSKDGFRTVYPPEQEISLSKTYPGKNEQGMSWKPWTGFRPGDICSFERFPSGGTTYLLCAMDLAAPVDLPVSMGNSDPLKIWLNGQIVFDKQTPHRSVATNQEMFTLPLKVGKNQLLVKFNVGAAGGELILLPLLPASLPTEFQTQAAKLPDRIKIGELRRFEESKAQPASVVVSPDGQSLLAGFSDATVRLYDIKTGKESHVYRGGNAAIYNVAFSADGKRIAAGSGAKDQSDNCVWLWDVDSPDKGKSFEGHRDVVNGVAFLNDGKDIVSSSSDRTIRIWSRITGQQVKSLFNRQTPWINSMALSPDGSKMILAGADSTLRLWDLHGEREISRFEGQNSPIAVAFSPDGSLAASGGRDQTLRLWDVQTAKEIRRFEGHGSWIVAVAFSSKGDRILTGSNDRTIRLWDTATGKTLRCFLGHGEGVRTVAFTRDDLHCISGSNDRTIRFWPLTR